jgi:hypothetical protein
VLDLSALASRIVAEIQTMSSQHRFHVGGVAEPVWIMGDALRLEQVL